MVNDDLTREHFTKQIAFNVIPHIDVFRDNGDTKEEWKMVVETQNARRNSHARNLCACAGFVGHSEAVNIEFDVISETAARAAFRRAGCAGRPARR